jgi:hypothetical protein
VLVVQDVGGRGAGCGRRSRPRTARRPRSASASAPVRRWRRGWMSWTRRSRACRATR